MAKFSDYVVPADHPAVLGGQTSAGDTVPFLVVIQNERGIGGYAFTPGGITWVAQFKSDDDVAAEQKAADEAQASAAKEANLQAAKDADDTPPNEVL